MTWSGSSNLIQSNIITFGHLRKHKKKKYFMRISSCWVIFYHLWNWVKFIFEDKNLYFFKLKFIIVLLCENKQEKKFRRFSFLWRNFLFHVFSRGMIVNTHTHRGCVCVCVQCVNTHTSSRRAEAVQLCSLLWSKLVLPTFFTQFHTW